VGVEDNRVEGVVLVLQQKCCGKHGLKRR